MLQLVTLDDESNVIQDEIADDGSDSESEAGSDPGLPESGEQNEETLSFLKRS